MGGEFLRFILNVSPLHEALVSGVLVSCEKPRLTRFLLHSLKKCLVLDILAHLLQQVGQVAEPEAHPSIHRRVHSNQSPRASPLFHPMHALVRPVDRLHALLLLALHFLVQVPYKPCHVGLIIIPLSTLVATVL